MSKTLPDINSSFLKAQANNLSFASWRLPEDSQIHQLTGITAFKKISDIASPSFVISPFDKNSDEFLLIEKTDLSNLKITKSNSISKTYKAGNTNKTSYIELVNKGIQSIQKGEFEKVVLSRREELNLNNSFNPLDLFLRLVKAYPKAFVSMIYTPELGIWIGASPELLIKKDKEKIQSISLAGTINSEEVENGQELSSKDIVEQEIVSQFIREKLNKLNIPFTESNPEIINTGNLNHIKTSFKASNSNIELEQLINALHPTPAICGFPRESSKAFIIKHEDYARSLYGGLIGPVFSPENAELYVNLRCIQIIDKKGILYAGAGILENSDAEKEWQETENKMDTLRSFI